MTDKEIKFLLEDIRRVAKDETSKALNSYIKISNVSVISVSGGSATVRLPFSKTDGTEDFVVPIVGYRIVSAGDVATIAYWCNISTAVLFSGGVAGGGSTPSAGDYNQIANKPQINGVELIGNKLSAQLNIVEDKSYIHNQNSSSSTWNITHNMHKFPVAIVVDSGENVVVGDIRYVDEDSLVISFSAPFSGKAYLN